jgi:hypothetical protein
VQVKKGLRSLAAMLSRRPGVEPRGDDGFQLQAAPQPVAPQRSKTAAKKLAKASRKKR